MSPVREFRAGVCDGKQCPEFPPLTDQRLPFRAGATLGRKVAKVTDRRL